MDKGKGYEVRLDIFEGPLDLLLHLIEKNKIDIYDIPIAVLTEQYLEYLELYEALDMEIASEFIVMAATLLQIKSRILLPARLAEAEKDDMEEDPRQELVERLLEYKRFQQASAELQKMASQQGRSFYRAPLSDDVLVPYGRDMDIKLLWQAFQKILKRQPRERAVGHIVKERYTVAEKLAQIELLLKAAAQKTLLFTDFFAPDVSKDELVASFLALLELIRLKKITVFQAGLFAAIKVKWRD